MDSNYYAIGLFETKGIVKRTFSADRARQAIEAAGVEFVSENSSGTRLRLRRSVE